MTAIGRFDGKVAVVTGAGRGLGRQHALMLAREGAHVVVNDLGCDTRGDGHDTNPADQVVAEIRGFGGRAEANHGDVSDWEAASELVQQAVDSFGRLDVLVNNAGILRDRMSFNMTEDEWDVVVRVHLKGHFAPSRAAAADWRQRFKETGEPVGGAIVNTASGSGLWGNTGQANYAAAKMGIASLTIVLARELAPMGVRVNGIAPAAATRLLGDPGAAAPEGAGSPAGGTGALDPSQISPLVCWLASELSSDVTGQMFNVNGAKIELLGGWHPLTRTEPDPDGWTVEAIHARRAEVLGSHPTGLPPFLA